MAARSIPLKTRRILVVALAAVALGVVALGASGQVRWRVQLIAHHFAGRIPDITLGELLAMLKPGSGQWLEGMVENHSPYETVINPHASQSDRERGGEIFASTCAGCHGMGGEGTDVGPSLLGREFKNGNTPWGVYRSIRYGVPGTSMPPHDRPTVELWQLAAYVTQISRRATPAVEAPPTLAATVDAPFELIRAAGQPGADWLTYSGSYSAQRHSTLQQIGKDNAATLAPRWIHQLEGKFSRLETSPIVRSGVMYITVPPLKVLALDAATGETLWSFEQKVPADIRPACCDGGPVNRGLAILGDKVFIGTPDARLIALSARTGKKLWDTEIAPYKLGYSVTAAPLAYGNLVVIGVGSGDFATRCFLAAFDAESGAERWRFNTIPAPGEPGHETWTEKSWKTGGSAPWMTGSYDPETDTLFWGIGNAVPKYDASLRPGDNLYSNSIVALRGASGKILWHFQTTPGDAHGWGANHPPILAELPETGGGSRANLLLPERNAFYYRLDRNDGKFLLGVPYAQQNWTDGLDDNGRPRPRASAIPNRVGAAVYPGNGATNWWSSSYDAKLGLVFIPTHEKGLIFLAYDQDDPQLGEPNFEGGIKDIPGDDDYWAVRALRAGTGELAWEHRFNAELKGPEAGTGGLMSTASGVLFGGNQNNFYAWDSASGKALWSFPIGKAITAAPVSYLAGDEQYVAIAGGRLIVAFGLPRT